MNALTIAPYVEAPDRPWLSPSKVAKGLHVQLAELAAAVGVHRNTLSANPESPRVQAFLRNTLRVLSEARDVIDPSVGAVGWLLNEPLPAFRRKTPWELIEAGRTEDVLDYLRSYSAGYVG